MQIDERRIAVFIDFENVAMGVRESRYGNFDIDLVLKRLVEKGKITVKRAYSDWHRYTEFKRAFHQAAIELIDVPQSRYSGKNSADIRMVVDALDLSYQRDHIDTFVLVSGGQRLLAPGLEVEGIRPVRHRDGGQAVLLRSVDQQLRRVHLL